MGFFSEFRSHPSHRNGTAPLGVWKFSKTWVSSDWSKNPSVPSPQDFGILSLADKELPVNEGKRSEGGRERKRWRGEGEGREREGGAVRGSRDGGAGRGAGRGL
jgi:hypothetical protein